MNEDLAYLTSFDKVHGLGPVRLYSILKHFGSFKEAWNSPLENFQEISTLTTNNIQEIENFRKNFDPQSYFEKILKAKIGVLVLTQDNYPELLKKIPDPPFLLYYKGVLKKSALEKCIGVVGTRQPSYSGKKIAYNLGKDLASYGITVVSGMAAGIDTESHKGCLSIDTGYTIAVLGCGVDQVYPSSNKKLYEEISERGLLLSAYSPGTTPDARNFPPRNRIISGLSTGIAVIEAGEKSGTLITVDFANEQGREVFAVPGDILNPSSKGTNNLIKQGAGVLTEVSDIIQALNWKVIEENNQVSVEKDSEPHIEILNLTDLEKNIYMLIDEKPQHLDYIISKTSLPLADINSNLIMLEIKQLIKQLPGKLFVKV